MNRTQAFHKASKPAALSQFCVRISDVERAMLERRAGNQPLSAYVRAQLFGDNAQKRRAVRRPKTNDAEFAKALALLGQSRFSSNLNQIAKAANTGRCRSRLRWSMRFKRLASTYRKSVRR